MAELTDLEEMDTETLADILYKLVEALGCPYGYKRPALLIQWAVSIVQESRDLMKAKRQMMVEINRLQYEHNEYVTINEGMLKQLRGLLGLTEDESLFDKVRDMMGRLSRAETLLQHVCAELGVQKGESINEFITRVKAQQHLAAQVPSN